MENTNQSTRTERVSAFIAEDSVKIRERLVALLAEGGEIDILGEADTVRGAIEGILKLRPEVVTLDIRLLNGSGLQVIREVRKLAPEVAFVILTNNTDPHYRRAFAQEGARCFLDKSSEFGRVKDEILAAHAESHGSLAQNSYHH